MDVRKLFPLLFVLAGLPHQAVAQEPYIVRNNVLDCVRVRDDSNTDANVIGCLGAGAAVSVLDSRPYWHKIDFGEPQTGSERVNIFPTHRRRFLCNNLGQLDADRRW